MIRLFVDQPLEEGARVALDPDQSRYLLTVMRRSVGDALLLFNGRDGERRAEIAEAGKRGATLQVLEQTRSQVSGPDLELCVALVKRARLEIIAEKATELGVRRIRLLTTRRTNADHARVDRLQAIATEAAEQTGRLDVPEVVAPVPLDRLLDGWPADRRLMFCDEGEGFTPGDPTSAGGQGDLPPALSALAGPRPELVEGWSVLIGPEGGFDPAERARLHAAPFATAVSLGPRILRADTATIAALTLWQATLGDWR